MSRIFDAYLALIFGHIPNVFLAPKPEERKDRAGLSLVELMIVVSILAVLFLICGGGVWRATTTMSGAQQQDATAQAITYGRTLYGETATAICVRSDSDGDGYVSCTLVYDGANGKVNQAIECAAGFTINEGCRIPKMLAPAAR